MISSMITVVLLSQVYTSASEGCPHLPLPISPVRVHPSVEPAPVSRNIDFVDLMDYTPDYKPFYMLFDKIPTEFEEINRNKLVDREFLHELCEFSKIPYLLDVSKELENDRIPEEVGQYILRKYYMYLKSRSDAETSNSIISMRPNDGFCRLGITSMLLLNDIIGGPVKRAQFKAFLKAFGEELTERERSLRGVLSKESSGQGFISNLKLYTGSIRLLLRVLENKIRKSNKLYSQKISSGEKLMFCITPVKNGTTNEVVITDIAKNIKVNSNSAL